MKRIFWILAGHGGADPGAGSNTIPQYWEADLTLELRELVSQRLRAKGLTVYNEGNATPFKKVINWLFSAVGVADFVLDIHFNSVGRKDANGVEAITPVNPSAAEEHLADVMADNIAKVGFYRRPTIDESRSQHKSLGVMRNKGHAVLIEVCFISNDKDLYHYLRNKEKVADAIVAAIEDTHNKF